MSNINDNRLNVTMTPAQITAVKAALQTIQTNMPFLTGLTVEERIALPKINVSNKAFTEDAINSALNNANMIPSYFSTTNLQTDYNLYVQLDELILLVDQVAERISDTQMLAGSEAYVSALASYRLFGAAADAGVQGADAIYDRLKNRFANQGNTSTNTNTPPTT
jgi:hypothetical protein